jgi:hypothetical protein
MYESKSASPDAKSHWDLCVSGELVLLAYHCCQADGNRVPAGYSQATREYACSNCDATHSTYIERGDHLFSPSGVGTDSTVTREPVPASV